MPGGNGRLLYRINNDSSLWGRGFTVENGLMTPTLKVRRRIVLQQHAPLVEALY